MNFTCECDLDCGCRIPGYIWDDPFGCGCGAHGAEEAAYLAAVVDGTGSHYFSASTLYWFGSCERSARRYWNGEWVYSERSANAPEGVPQWRAVLFSATGEFIESAAGHSRVEAENGVADGGLRFDLPWDWGTNEEGN